MSTNFSQFRTDIFNTVAAASSDPNWLTEFSDVLIDRAEQRIYRDLDLLGTRVTDTSGGLTPFQQQFTLPTSIGTFLVVEQANLLTPAGVSSSLAQRVPLVRCNPVFINMMWPSNSSFAGTPSYFAMLDNANILVGAAPSSSFGMEIRGTQRPAPLSATNSSTILTQMLPDLFFASGMIEAASFMRETEPTLYTTWTQEYGVLMKSALVEEKRKMFQAEGWVDKLPSPVATPPRQ